MTKPASTNDDAKTTARNPDTNDHDSVNANPSYRTPEDSLTTTHEPPAAPTKQRNDKLLASRRLNF